MGVDLRGSVAGVSDAGVSQGTSYGDRAISVLGLLVFQSGFWLTSNNRSHVPWWVYFRSAAPIIPITLCPNDVAHLS